MKKALTVLVTLLAFSSFADASKGCWRNGKYVMCANDAGPVAEQLVAK